MPKKKIAAVLEEIADLMSEFDPNLAERFRAEPNNRLEIARLFFKDYSDDDDARPIANLAIKTASLEKGSDD